MIVKRIITRIIARGVKTSPGLWKNKGWGWTALARPFSFKPDFSLMKSYSMEDLKKDFSKMYADIHALAEKEKGQEYISKNLVFAILTHALLLNLNDYHMKEKMVRQDRRSLINDMPAYEQVVLMTYDIMGTGHRENLEAVCQDIGIEISKLENSLSRLQSTDPNLQNEFKILYEQIPKIPKEGMIHNPKNFTDKQLVEIAQKMLDELSTYTYTPSEPKAVGILKGVYMSDQLALKHGIEPEDLIIEPGKMTPEVLAAFYKITEGIKNRQN